MNGLTKTQQETPSGSRLGGVLFSIYQANMTNNTQLTAFNFEDYNVNILTIDGEPWFVSKEVAMVLGYTDPSMMLKHVDSEDKRTINPQSLDSVVLTETFGSNTFRLSLINESGLYACIFGSQKLEAKAFKKWVTSEVLPTIRKTGSYSVKQLSPGELLKLQADAIIAIEQEMAATKQDVQDIKNYLEDADNLARVFIAKGNLTPPPELTLATKINMVVRSYCAQTNSDYQPVWRDIYREFKLREHIDVVTRYNNALCRGDISKAISKLSYVIDRLQLGERLYSTVVACCIQGKWSNVESLVVI